MKSKSNIFFVTICVVCFSGCALHYKPKGEYPVNGLKEYTLNGSVKLVNGQSLDEWIVLMNKLYWNKKMYTDVAINIAGRELQKKGMNISDDAEKSLVLSVDSIRLDSGMVMGRTELTMRATTGDGYSVNYKGSDRSAFIGNVKSQSEKSLTDAVVEMLNDRQIIEYLSK